MDLLWHIIYHAALMLWETLWALVLGFTLSAFVRVFIKNEQVAQQFGRAGLREVLLATFLGAASSSCSYAATAAGKTLFKKGAALVPMLAFMFASTNLVFELGFLLWLLMGWTFVFAEIFGAFVLIGVMWVLVKLTLPKGLIEEARAHNGEEMVMESCCHCHGDEEMSVSDELFTKRIRRKENWANMAGAFFMDAGMLWKEITIGFLIAGILMVLVPNEWWKNLFITGGPDFLRLVENAVVGPLISVFTFTCSCGNIPLAGVLWSGGISFGGVVSFIYADLIIIPLILIYRKYYGTKAAIYITTILFVSMVCAGIIVDLIFSAMGWIPAVRESKIMEQAEFAWNYTTWLNIVAIVFCSWLFWIRSRNKSEESEGCMGDK